MEGRGRSERRQLAELVAAAAARWPDEEALVGDAERLTWSDLDRRTRRLAAALVELGVGPGDRVAVARPKGSESFEAVHGVLRAGAVVVPIDPQAPPAAAQEILADAAVSAIVGEVRTISSLDPWSVVTDLSGVIATGATDDERVVRWVDVIDRADLDDVELPAIDPDDIAYVIYTSGSTGRPKGIVHTHRSGLNYALAVVEHHGLVHDDRVAGMCPLHFDMSTLELYAAPVVGACVVVVGDALMRLFLAEFAELCERERVTVWYTVPYFLRQLTARGALDRFDLGSVRLVMYGGEPFPPGALHELMAAVPEAVICNVYGPAEVNECTFHVLDAAPGDDGAVPIGRPWAAAEIRIVDEAGDDVPAGTPGELFVSATTAMRGYWRRPDLTAQRLTPRGGGRPPWYATGDVVQSDAEGLLWFLGRRDFQVKVRGVRLELESVESVLTDAPGIAHAVAGATGPAGDSASIAAAVVAADEVEVDLDAIRRWCVDHLPPVAVPKRIEIWPVFPATGSGKIDRASVRARLLAPPAASAFDPDREETRATS